MATYPADPANFIRAFPERIAEPPKLLLDFADWLRERPWGSVGSFGLTAGWSDDLIFGGARFFREFALFMRLPDGSRIGYWLKDGAAPETSPIVLLGSEGEFETLGVDLQHFLMRLSASDFDRSAASDLVPQFDDEEENGESQQARKDFADWVSQRTKPRDVSGLSGSEMRVPPTGDPFAVWAETEGRAPEIEQDADPRLAALTDILAPYRPGAEAWEFARTAVSIGWAGDDVEIVDASHGHQPLAEREAMLPHLAALRDGEAGRTPGLGLWSHAWLNISKTGSAELRTDHLFEPKFFIGRPPDEAFRADQARAPRTDRRIPDWLRPILAG